MKRELFSYRLACKTDSQCLALAAIAILLLLGASSCRSHDSPTNELTISAAVSLRDAFNEIAEIHQQRTGTKILFNFGASGTLQKQIESGAPADLFASAGARQMDDLVAGGFVTPETRSVFARNELVLIVPAGVASLSSFAELANETITKVAVGNPKTVPAGQYTKQTLTNLNLLPQIQGKLIFAEDVRQVLDYVVRDEVEAGIVYSSDALSAGDKVRVVARAAEESHDPILYPIAIVKDSKQAAAAQKFIDLVLSSAGQDILSKYGFLKIK